MEIKNRSGITCRLSKEYIGKYVGTIVSIYRDFIDKSNVVKGGIATELLLTYPHAKLDFLIEDVKKIDQFYIVSL